MKKLNINAIINIVIIVWIVIWFYYLVFNWDVFIVQLNTNIGFSSISIYPFLFFFIISLIGFGIIKFAANYSDLQQQAKEKENKNKLSMLEKDMEILRLKEVLFKMQSDDMTKSASTINALKTKLDSLSEKIESNNNDEESKE